MSDGYSGSPPVDTTALVTLAPASSARNTIQPTSASAAALILKGAAAQSVPVGEVQDSAGATKISWLAAGTIQSDAAVGTLMLRAGASGPGIGLTTPIGVGPDLTIGAGANRTILAGGTVRFATGVIEFASGFNPNLAGTTMNITGGASGHLQTNNNNVRILEWDVNAAQKVRLRPYTADYIAVRGPESSGRTADLMRFFTHSGDTAEKLAITSTGLFKWTDAANQQTTVGAAGGASALPATPTKYLKVVDSAGTTLVVPAYAAS